MIRWFVCNNTTALGLFLVLLMHQLNPTWPFFLSPTRDPSEFLCRACENPPNTKKDNNNMSTTTAAILPLSYDHASTLAKDWAMGWNRHDTNEFVDTHLDQHAELVSPFVFTITGTHNEVRGKEVVRNYFATVLNKNPALHLVLLDVLVGLDSVAIYYKSGSDRRECVNLFVNPATGKVYKIVNHVRHCG